MGVYFLAAGRSSRNRERTLDRGHHLDEIVALLRPHEADQLRALVPQDEPVYLWGANKEGDLPRLKAGDYVVDVKNKAVLQVFRYCLYLQTDDTRLQEHVGWDAEKSPDERRPYRFVFFLRSPLQTNRSDKAYFQAAFGELANQNWLVGQRYFNDEDIVRACEKTRNLTIESLLGISADSNTQTQNGDFQSDEFLRVMRRYKTEGVVFQTPVESHRYFVESVDADGCPSSLSIRPGIVGLFSSSISTDSHPGYDGITTRFSLCSIDEIAHDPACRASPPLHRRTPPRDPRFLPRS